MTTSDESIFEQALQHTDAAVRAAFLEQACAGQPVLRREIESLLAAYSQGEFLESPLCARVADTDVDAGPQRPGTQSGRYKLLEQIGEGGMGLVYMAEQLAPVKRRVAMKIIKPGMDSRQVVARFEAERQTLALMNHPNIAAVHDAGTMDDGRPFFVMELVRGLPITDYCDRARLTVAKRLELFVAVCRAVVHAHQKGIIHRDIKPSNVLVTLHDGVPVPKVIDFGVAKAVGQQLTEKTLFTAFGLIVGTPLYMSPEQAELSGLDVDTRSDVYSLGVLLYELLTGHTPFDRDQLSQAGIDEMRRIIREDEPPSPSRRVSTIDARALTTAAQRRGIDERQMATFLRGELDWLVMKALEKDRVRRYESASAFAADVERYLRDEAVQACPPTVLYRCGKFARRFRVALSVSAALIAMLALGLVAALWQAGQARQAERLADERLQGEQAAFQTAREQRRQAERYLQMALESIDRLLDKVAEEKLLNEPHMDSLRQRILADALAYCETLARDELDDPLVQLRTAQAARRVAKLHRRLGDLAQAVSASRRAIAILEEVNLDRSDLATVTYESVLAHAQLAACQQELLEFDDAEKLYRKVIRMCRDALDKLPDHDAIRSELAMALRGLATLQSGNRHQLFALAMATRKEAIEVWRKIQEVRPDDVELQSHLAAEYHNLASEFLEQGNLAEAEEFARIAIREQEEAVAAAPSAWQHEYLGNHYSLLGRVLQQGSRLDEATASLEQCLNIRTRLWQDHPVVPSYQLSAAQTDMELAYAWTFHGNTAKALESAERTLAQCEDLAGRFPRYKVHLAIALDCVAQVEMTRSQSSQRAQALLERSIQIHEELHEQDPGIPAYRFNLAGAKSNLATIYDENLDYDRADREYQTALQLTENLIKDFPASRDYYLRHAIIAHNLSGLLRSKGRGVESVAVLRGGHRVARLLHERWTEVPEYEAAYATAASHLAWGLIDLGETDEPKNLLEFAQPILHRHSDDGPEARFECIYAQWGMTRILRDRDRRAATKQLENTATALRKMVQSSPEMTAYRISLAEVCFDLAETVSSDVNRTVEDHRTSERLAIEEGVMLYRELLAEKGAAFVLPRLRYFADSPSLLAHEAFRQLMTEARSHSGQ